MSRTIERTLTMLLPTATGGIPRELIDTTSSLITQSRHKISNLAPQEEPAREMLCAHLACERLRTKLDLPHPPDRPPAPVPPKLYKTLYKQFSETLATGSSSSRTPTATPSKPRATRATTNPNVTPSKTPRTTSKFISGTPSTAKSTADKKIEQYIPIITGLCTSNSAAKAHVTAGLRYIFSSAKYKNLTETPYTLVGVLYVVVSKELGETDEFDDDGKRAWYEGKVGEVYRLLKVKGLVKGRETVFKEEFNRVLEEVAGQDMRETRWFMEIPKGCGEMVEEDEVEEEVVEEEGPQFSEKRKATEAGMESGIGSMIQDRLDFLSDKRRQAFSEWKADALRRIAQLEARGSS